MNTFLNIDEELVKYHLYNLKQLVFEVTDLCNLRCKYCGFSELYKGYDEREGKKLSFAKAKQIIDYLIPLWREVYSSEVNYPLAISFYGGEPLMNMPLIKQVVNYLEQVQGTGKSFYYSMTTNAMLLDKYMDYLVENEFRLLISLDGDENAHSYRVDHSGKNSFSYVFRNVKMLQDKYPEYFHKRVMFNAVLHNRNNLDSTYRFIMENFNKTPSITPLNNSGIREEKKSEFKAMYQNSLQSLYNSSDCESFEAEMFIHTPRISTLTKQIHMQSGNVFNDYNDLLVDNSNFEYPPTGTCLPFSKKMFISVNGKILPCERVDHDFFFGNVYDDHVELNLKKVAELHNAYVFKFEKQCRCCAINRQCIQCVYQNDEIRKENVTCLSFCNQNELDEKISLNLDFLRNHPHYYERIMNEIIIRS